MRRRRRRRRGTKRQGVLLSKCRAGCCNGYLFIYMRAYMRVSVDSTMRYIWAIYIVVWKVNICDFRNKINNIIIIKIVWWNARRFSDIDTH